MRTRMGCVSGSPKRQLNSSTLIEPSVATISPAYRKPRYGVPSAASALTVGHITSCIARSCTAAVTTGAGE